MSRNPLFIVKASGPWRDFALLAGSLRRMPDIRKAVLSNAALHLMRVSSMLLHLMPVRLTSVLCRSVLTPLSTVPHRRTVVTCVSLGRSVPMSLCRACFLQMGF
ncbi:unnamed protein product [Cochlearia groenlandica]